MELNKPNPFTPNKNHIGRDWQIWKKKFLIYLRLSGGYEKYTEEGRSLLLLNLMGTEAIKAMDKMVLIDKENNMDILMMKFDEVFDPPANELEERYKFFSRRKSDKESIDDYVIDLKDKASKCNFGIQTNKFIIDMVIRNMDSVLRATIFIIEDITLPDIVQRYKQYTLSNEKMLQLSRDIAKSLISENSENNQNSNQNSNKRTTRSENYRKNGAEYAQRPNPASSAVYDQFKFKPVCSKCGTNHPNKQCPAFDVTCHNCSTKGHYTNKCKETKSDGNRFNSMTKQISSSDTSVNRQDSAIYSTSKSSNTSNIQINKQNEASSNPIHNVNTPINSQNEAYSSDTSVNEQDSAIYCTSKSSNATNIQINKQNEASSNPIHNVNTSIHSQNETQRPFEARLVDCLWSESKHPQGQCRHDVNCRRCNLFPHNICFQCKNNPHDIECHYKMVITLPSQVTNTTTNNSKTNHSNTKYSNTTTNLDKNPNNSDLQKCSECGVPHLQQYCCMCKLYVHKTTTCYLYKRKQNSCRNSTTSDPLLNTYVNVEHTTPTQTPFTTRNNPLPRKNQHQFTKNNTKKNKDDVCSIS